VKRDTKVRVASHVGKNDEEGAQGLLGKVQERMAKADDPLLAGQGDPLFASDGDLSIPPAMLAVFGKEVEEPVHRGPKWKSPRIEPDENVIFVRAIKQRDTNGRLVGILEEVTWGDPDEVWQRLDPDGDGQHISTFCVERDNLTSRLHNSRLARKTLRFSKQREMLEAAVALEDAYYNFCLSHDSLKRPLDPPLPTNGNGSPKKWSPRTPMMAEGLTHHVWTLEELLSFRVPPRHLWADP
jgi:IS1 family transposase